MASPDLRAALKPIVNASKRLESDVQGSVCRYARERGVLAEKFVSQGRRSVPDYLFSAKHNAHWFIEFKAPGKRPTPLQAEDHARRRQLGHYVFVVDNVPLGKWVIDLMLEIMTNE